MPPKNTPVTEEFEDPGSALMECATDSTTELLRIIWQSIWLILEDVSFTDMFWAVIPYIAFAGGIIWFLSKVEWKGSASRDPDSHRSHSRSRR